MSEKVQPLLQVLVNQLTEGNLTPQQHALAKQDLAMMATRSFCQGQVGVGNALTITINGQELQLDAVDLTLLLNNLPPEQNLRASHFEQAAQIHAHHVRTPQKLTLKNPEYRPMLQVADDGVECLERLFAQTRLTSPLYAEMNEYIRQAPLKAFNQQQQLVAKQVIDLLPAAAQGKLENIPAQLIGVHDFVEVMQHAAHQKQLPQELQEFRESCARHDGLKKAIYCHPNVAARILGLSAPSPSDQLSNQLLAREIAGQIVKSTTNVHAPRTQISNVVKRLIGSSSTTVTTVKQVFRALGEYTGFATQEMANVPSCFAEIECPAASRVPANPTVHANVVSLGHGRQAIAAMQPVHTPSTTSSNLPAFYELLSSEANTTVFDLRSNTDFVQGSFDYCPDVGTTRQITNTATGEKIQITTVEKSPLKQANCNELTVRIQVGAQEAKLIKVIQFKNWPDHGVIKPDQLRSLRSLMDQELSAQQRVVTHCRAGVGRTGTLLAYEHLRHSLIDQNNGNALVNAKGQVDSSKLLQVIAEVVAQGRIERGPYFVQSEEQFNLLYRTLKDDLIANTAANAKVNSKTKPVANRKAAASAQQAERPLQTTPPSQPAAAPMPQHSPVNLPYKRIKLSGHPAASFSPEPANQIDGRQNWQSILKAGEDVVEIISNPNRFVDANAPSNSGLGVYLNQLVPGQGHQSKVERGNNYLIAKIPLGSKQILCDGLQMQIKRFEIQYQTAGDNKIKTLYFTQFLTPFDGKKLTASQLNSITEQLGEAGHIKPKWLTSVRGVGRPSALLVAQAMRKEIEKGTISNEKSLIKVLDTWIAQGREKMGPLFINSREQREQLIKLGITWLGNKQD